MDKWLINPREINYRICCFQTITSQPQTLERQPRGLMMWNFFKFKLPSYG